MMTNEVDNEDDDHNIEPGTWRNVVNWQDVPQQDEQRNRATTDAIIQREQLKQFFSSPGRDVPWQNNMIPNVNSD